MKLLRKISLFLKRDKEKIAFNAMKKEADHQHHITGRQYFIIPDENKNLLLMDNRSIEDMNRKLRKQGASGFSHFEILKMAYYKTAAGSLTRNNKG